MKTAIAIYTLSSVVLIYMAIHDMKDNEVFNTLLFTQIGIVFVLFVLSIKDYIQTERRIKKEDAQRRENEKRGIF